MKNFVACDGKVRYDNKKHALTAVNFFRRNGRGSHGRPERLRPYPCNKCRGWHLTKA